MTKINEIKMQLDSVKKNFAKETDHAITNAKKSDDDEALSVYTLT